MASYQSAFIKITSQDLDLSIVSCKFIFSESGKSGHGGPTTQVFEKITRIVAMCMFKIINESYDLSIITKFCRYLFNFDIFLLIPR